jgi:uncharacterized membrane protein YhiD involved in acid resistance
MQTFDFTFVVLPLTISVIALISIILMISHKTELKEKRVSREVNKFLKEKEKKKEEFQRQTKELDSLLKENSIDSQTYERLNVLIKMNEEKLNQATDLLGFVNNYNKIQIKKSL